MVTMNTNECQNIASSIVNNFEECSITLLQTRMLMHSQIDHQTIERRLDEIRMQSRSKRVRVCERVHGANCASLGVDSATLLHPQSLFAAFHL